MWLNFFEVALLGGVLCLDRVALQVMISRPVVVGPVIGMVLSEPFTGLIIGAFIELLWIDRSPMGLYIPPNDSIATVLATAGGHTGRERIGTSAPRTCCAGHSPLSPLRHPCPKG